MKQLNLFGLEPIELSEQEKKYTHKNRNKNYAPKIVTFFIMKK
jgi:hypothetical protein